MSLSKEEYNDLQSHISRLEDSRVAHYIAQKAYEEAQRNLNYYLLKIKEKS